MTGPTRTRLFLSRVVRRLADADRAPRQWWFPPASRLVDEEREPSDQAAIQQELGRVLSKLAVVVGHSMFAFLGVSLFCVVAVLSIPDSALVVPEPKLSIPYTGVSMSLPGVLFAGALILVAVLAYLQIFWGEWLRMRREQECLTPNSLTVEYELVQPFLFALDNRLARFLTNVIFYWLGPLVLALLAWKAGPRPGWGFPLGYLTGMSFVILFFLQVRRCRGHRRGWRNAPYWFLMLVCVAVGMAAPYESAKFFRPLDLAGADLHGAWLMGANLRYANMRNANLKGAALTWADLTGADLGGADVREARLAGAQLDECFAGLTQFEGGNLRGASLERATLVEANLRKASFGGLVKGVVAVSTDLSGAEIFLTRFDAVMFIGVKLTRAVAFGSRFNGGYLVGVDFEGANLTDARFTNVGLYGVNFRNTNLTRADLSNAELGGENYSGHLAELRGESERRLSAGRFSPTSARMMQFLIEEELGTLGAADFGGAELSGANLKGADLRGATGLTLAQVRSAITDERTRLPEELRVASRGGPSGR